MRPNPGLRRKAAAAYRGMIRAVEAVLIIITVALAVIVPAGVFFRYLLNAALSWTDELGGFLLVWMTFLGCVVALDRGTHLDFDFLALKLPPRARRLAALVCDLALAALLVVILVNGIAISQRLMSQTAVSVPLPRGLVYSVMPLSAALMLSVLAARWLMPGATSRDASVREATAEPSAGTEQ